MMFFQRGLACGLLLLAACSRSDDAKGGDSARTAAALPSAPPPATTPGAPNACPATGKWALCSFENRLKRSGFVARKVDSVSAQRPGFSVAPTVYKIDRGRVEVFIYDDAAALEKDIAGIDTLTIAPRGATPVWPTGAALVRNGNLAAVFTDQSARQAERLILAVTAGAPSGG